MSQLTIYKASAGSGKTFTLTRRYLELLFQQKDNYKHILAATFTNKATEEMKERIIAELHLLASGQNSAHREYLLSQLPKIKSEEQLNTIAAQTLSAILHDYSRLSVTTIDRFFQKIIRSFAREMNVSSNYNIELDADSVLSKASEQMFFDLDKKGNEQLLQWVTRYAEEQITEGKSWNFTRNITSLSKEFLKEEYKSLSNNSENQLGDFIILNSFLTKITKTQKSIQQEFKTLAEKAIKIAEGYELKALNFKYGKTSGVNFIYNCYKGEIPKEIKKRTLDMSTDTSAWYKASDKCAGDIQAACDAGMFEILNKLILLWTEKYPIYNSIAVVRQNFYSLGVLSDLERQLKRYTDENNLFLLANSNELIAKIIDHSDTPFIYEKTGNNYKHFMIDEFQDTSRLQWDNIKPLINNSMGEGHKSLLVGDVKQSIYRWRNSDWKQLANGIQEEYQHQSHEEVLPNNWRSTQNIIKFNNSAFQAAAKHFKDHFSTETNAEEELSHLFDAAYADIIQNIPDSAKPGGRVELQFFGKENKDDWEEIAMQSLCNTIEQLQDKGYELKDIAILSRNKKEGAKVSRHLLEYASKQTETHYRYDIISDEALWISSSYDVKFLVNTLRYLISEESIIATELNLIYHNYIQPSNDVIVNTESALNANIIEKLEALTSLSLMETCEELINRFGLGHKAEQAIFIQSFIDLINTFELNQNGGLDEFLTWWDEKGYMTSVSTPEGQNAINIMTIHKSKGLEYKIILIPYLGWDISDSKGMLWTSTDVEPLNELSHFPVKVSKALADTVFKDDYVNEKLLQYIDNLNLLYVAFTRAKEGIYGYGLSTGNKTDGALSQILARQTNSSDDTINLANYWDEEKLLFSFGELPTNTTKPTEDNHHLWLKEYTSNQHNNHLKLRLQSHDFEIQEDELLPTASKTGKLWHRLFEQMKDLSELPQAIERMVSEGAVPRQEADELQATITKSIQHPLIQEWFSPSAHIKTEAAIITPEGYNYRPDRIVETANDITVIDFKFGHIEKNNYKKQVQRYTQLLSSISTKTIKGYLWYVSLGKTVEV